MVKALSGAEPSEFPKRQNHPYPQHFLAEPICHSGANPQLTRMQLPTKLNLMLLKCKLAAYAHPSAPPFFVLTATGLRYSSQPQTGSPNWCRGCPSAQATAPGHRRHRILTGINSSASEFLPRALLQMVCGEHPH